MTFAPVNQCRALSRHPLPSPPPSPPPSPSPSQVGILRADREREILVALKNDDKVTEHSSRMKRAKHATTHANMIMRILHSDSSTAYKTRNVFINDYLFKPLDLATTLLLSVLVLVLATAWFDSSGTIYQIIQTSVVIFVSLVLASRHWNDDKLQIPKFRIQNIRAIVCRFIVLLLKGFGRWCVTKGRELTNSTIAAERSDGLIVAGTDDDELGDEDEDGGGDGDDESEADEDGERWGKFFRFLVAIILFTSGSFKLTTGQWSVCGFKMYDPYNTGDLSWGDIFDLNAAVGDAAQGDPLPWSDYEEALYFDDIGNNEDVWNFMVGSFAANVLDGNNSAYINDFTRIVGSVRIRQARMPVASCMSTLEVEDGEDTCYNFNSGRLEGGVTWKSKELSPLDSEGAFETLGSIIDDGWVDAGTKEVEVSFTTFNVLLQVFTIGKLRFLYTKAGSVKPMSQLTAFPEQFVTWLRDPIQAMHMVIGA